MKLSIVVRKRIKYYLKQKEMNVADLSKVSSVRASTISTFMNGKTELIRLNTLFNICRGFQISLKEFFSDPLFRTAEQENSRD